MEKPKFHIGETAIAIDKEKVKTNDPYDPEVNQTKFYLVTIIGGVYDDDGEWIYLVKYTDMQGNNNGHTRQESSLEKIS